VRNLHSPSATKRVFKPATPDRQLFIYRVRTS
jgi:hypothetical protein